MPLVGRRINLAEVAPNHPFAQLQISFGKKPATSSTAQSASEKPANPKDLEVSLAPEVHQYDGGAGDERVAMKKSTQKSAAAPSSTGRWAPFVRRQDN